MKIPSIKIKYNTFLKKGSPSIKDDFFIVLVTGYQGSGKTWFAVFDVYENYKKRKIRTNIKSLKIKNRDIEYFTKLEEIYDDDDDECIYLIDEVSKRFTKESRQDLRFYSWLQQSRKHRRYVYLITQEYIQVPTWLRGIANRVYTTSKIGFLPLFKTALGVPVLDEDTKEWKAENYKYIIYKRTKEVSSLYDTFEQINVL